MQGDLVMKPCGYNCRCNIGRRVWRDCGQCQRMPEAGPRLTWSCMNRGDGCARNYSVPCDCGVHPNLTHPGALPARGPLADVWVARTLFLIVVVVMLGAIFGG